MTSKTIISLRNPRIDIQIDAFQQRYKLAYRIATYLLEHGKKLYEAATWYPEEEEDRENIGDYMPFSIFARQLDSPEILGKYVINALIEETIIAKFAATNHIRSTQADLDIAISKFFNYVLEYQEAPLNYKELVAAAVNTIGNAFEQHLANLALREAVLITLQIRCVNTRHILLATEEEALSIIVRLATGENFAVLAREFSLSINKGELGWYPISRMVEPFAKAVRNGKIGLISKSVLTELGYHVIEILEFEDRSITQLQYQRDIDECFEAWLEEQHAAVDIEINDEWVNYLPE